jgi:hypothetical protein
VANAASLPFRCGAVEKNSGKRELACPIDTASRDNGCDFLFCLLLARDFIRLFSA